jgi:hypothetical protein
MVLTESDYLDFLIRASRDKDLLPPVIRVALAGTSLLFIGYSLADWDFRVLFRGITNSLEASLGYKNIAVQLHPKDIVEGEQQRAEQYLSQYFGGIHKIKIQVYWGEARRFAKELREHMEADKNGN